MVIDSSDTRFKRNTGDVVLDKAVNVDDGDAIAEVEDECGDVVEEDFTVSIIKPK